MSFSNENPVAVLVDAESVDAAEARSSIAALAAKFPPLILHAFGDFRRASVQNWCDVVEEFGGQALQVTPTSGHTHSVPICLTMNAMEILHAERASAICIFCGDGDFSQLAVRIRKAGLPVLGFGSARAGVSMAPWFDSWQVIDEDEQIPDHEVSGEDVDEIEQPQPEAPAWTEPDAETAAWTEPEMEASPWTDPGSSGDGWDTARTAPQARDEMPDVEPDRVAEPHISAIEPDVVENADLVLDQAIDELDIELSVAELTEQLNDDDAMAAIEGKRRPCAKTIENPPPLSDDFFGPELPADATLLLSGFIDENLNHEGYALLADVANAATAIDLLVPPDQKSTPDVYLKRLVAHDARFEITTMAMGGLNSEFIRRV